jgi:beta propeller repeat protein
VGNQVIVMFDLTTGQTVPLTPENQESLLPTIDGDRVVYARLPVVGDWQLLTFDLKTGRESQFSTISRDVGLGRFSLSGSRVAWHTRRNNNWDVYVFDFTTSQETRVTTDPADQADPVIVGDRVVWGDRRQNGTWWDVYAYDLTTKTETRITQGTTMGRGPALSADRILWGDIRGGFFSLYEYNFARSDHERLLNAGPVENGIVTAGPFVAWHDASKDIYAFDIDHGKQVQVTRLPSVQWLPAISRDFVVWEDYRNGNADIYIARLADVFKP